MPSERMTFPRLRLTSHLPSGSPILLPILPGTPRPDPPASEGRSHPPGAPLPDRLKPPKTPFHPAATSTPGTLLRRGRAAAWIDQTFDERGIPMSSPRYRPWADDGFRFDLLRWMRVRPKFPVVLLTLFLLWPPGTGVGQSPDDPVAAPERAAVIDRMASLLEDRYVFPDVGDRIADSLRMDERSGAFGGIHDPEDLAAALSERIRTLSGDGHLWVMVHVEPPPETATSPEPEPSSPPAVPVHLQRANFGFPRAEILPGNVGYLDVRQFVDPSVGGVTATAAMTYLGNTEAVVLDLRRSMGGSQAMVALLASWFLEDGDRVHLFDSYHRRSDTCLRPASPTSRCSS
jgi:hypothetical protein